MKYTLTAVALPVMLATQAQGTVKGKLINSASKTPLALATLSLFKATGTSLLAYRLSATRRRIQDKLAFRSMNPADW